MFYSVLDPVKLHVDGSGLFLFANSIGDDGSGLVVSFYGHWWLHVSHFGECRVDGAIFLSGIFE